MRLKLLAAGFLLLCLPAALQAMDAQSFYVKSLALQKKGAAALLSPDLKPLLAEMQNAGQTVRAENEKAKLAGKPLYCRSGQDRMNSEEFLAELGRIPAARRSKISVTQAFREILARKYPCK